LTFAQTLKSPMKLRLLILLAAALAASPAAGQTIKSLGFNTTNGQVVYSGTNPLTFTNTVYASQFWVKIGTNSYVSLADDIAEFYVPIDVRSSNGITFSATNSASVTRNNLGIGVSNSVTFGSLEISADQMLLDGTSIESVGFGGQFNFEERNFSQDGATVFQWSTNSFTVTPSATFATNVTVGGTLAVTGNVTLSGVNSTAPAQTADSADSLMTRDLSDARYSFSRWYDANDLLSGAQNVGVNPLITGNGSGHVANAILVTVSNINTKFMLPVDYRLSGEVKVVSYWTDRGQTNGGTTGDIAVWTFPFVVQPTTDTTTSGDVSGTQIQNTFTANYGGSGDSRFYVMEQTLNFATVTGISATNPMQLKWVQFQRRGADASDTSNDNIYLSGVHIYVP
jgi:hypothetical protein